MGESDRELGERTGHLEEGGGSKLYTLIGVLGCIAFVGFLVQLYLSRGEVLVLEGETARGHEGAVVFSTTGDIYYFDDRDLWWKTEEVGRRARVTGRVIVDDRLKALPGGGAGTRGKDRFILFPKIELFWMGSETIGERLGPRRSRHDNATG